MLHFPALVLVLMFTLGCILLLEVAARSLPLSFTKENTVTSTISGNLNHKRQTIAILPSGDTYPTLDITQIIAVSSESSVRGREQRTDI